MTDQVGYRVEYWHFVKIIDFAISKLAGTLVNFVVIVVSCQYREAVEALLSIFSQHEIPRRRHVAMKLLSAPFKKHRLGFFASETSSFAGI